LAKAFNYILKRWASFTLFLEDGRVSVQQCRRTFSIAPPKTTSRPTRKKPAGVGRFFLVKCIALYRCRLTLLPAYKENRVCRAFFESDVVSVEKTPERTAAGFDPSLAQFCNRFYKVRSGCRAIRSKISPENCSSGEILPPRGFGAALLC
jgi:hypothetical protein